MTIITTLTEKLAAAENDAAAWKADAGETHLKLVATEAERDEWKEKALDRGGVASNWMDRAWAAEAERDVARAWSAGRASDIVTLGAALGAAEAQVEALRGALVNLLAVHEGEGGTKYHAGDIARAALSTGED